MTPQAFTAKYGPDWKKFEFSEMGQSFLRVLESAHPVRKIPKGEATLGLRTNGATAILNEIAGYEALLETIRLLGAEPILPIPEDEDTFTEQEIH